MTQNLRPLIESGRSGDRAALDELAGCADRFVRIFHGSLSRTVRLGHGSTVDFVLEGMAEAFARLSDFEYRSDEEFYGWVARFIENRIRGVGRRVKSRKRAGRPVALDGGASEVAASAPEAVELVAAGEIRATLANALISLQVEHPTEMEVVLRKIFEGETWPQIRESLALSSEKRARTLFARGLDLLRPAVEKHLGDDAFERFVTS